MRTSHASLITAPLVFAACVSNPPPVGSEGAYCPNDNNCRPGLLCIDNTCQTPPPGYDGGVRPTPDAGVAPDAGEGVPDAGPPDTGVVGPPDQDTLAAGEIQTTADGSGLGYTLTGGAFMVRGADGRTSVHVEVGGLNPDTMYPVHVHDQACRTGGGDHYKIDPTVMDTQEANELWPAITSNPDGWGAGYVTVEHTARPEAQSIVVHEPGDNTRIGCIDLQADRQFVSTGVLEYFEGDPDPGYEGTVTMERTTMGTTVQVELTGTLTPDAVYPVHVHEQPCADDRAGGHYKIDPTVMDTVETNEIWPSATANPAGDGASGTANTDHIARAKARAIVVHDPDTNDKILCTDLTMQ